MRGFHNKVNTLAGHTEKAEVPLVVNLFQSVLDGFIRAEKKRGESEPTKVDFMAFSLFSAAKLLQEYNSYIYIYLTSGFQTSKKRKSEKYVS